MLPLGWSVIEKLQRAGVENFQLGRTGISSDEVGD